MTKLSPYQRYISLSRYSRFLPDKKRRETWEETVSRYCDFMESKFSDKFPKEMIYNAIVNLEVMPSMRGLMTAGKALDKDNAAIFNCSALPIDHIRAFDEILYILMCFSPETEIKTKRGNIRISELNCDDEILSLNDKTNQYEYIIPSQIMETNSLNKEKIELEFEDGYKVSCTVDHKFLTKNRGWVEAKNLTDEDNIENYHEISSSV